MQITIYHNSDCGTSCNALAKIRKLGYEPCIVEYLKTPLSRSQIVALIAKMDITARDVVRRKEPLFRELGLDEQDVTEDELLDALADNPVLMNRPIVVLEDGASITAQLCRPSARVVTMLQQTSPSP